MKKLFFYIALFLTVGLTAQSRISAPETDSTIVDSTTFVLKQNRRTYAVRFDSIRSTLKTYFDGIYGGGVDISDWTDISGTRAGSDLNVLLGDYDLSGNGHVVAISDDAGQVFIGETATGKGINIQTGTGVLGYAIEKNGEEIVSFAENWNASTNTPTLANTDTGVKGVVYRVSVTGTQDLGNGSQTYNEGDYIINISSAYEILADNNQGASPSGSDTQVQFNDSGSFGASSNLTWNNTNKELAVGGVGQVKGYTSHVGFEATGSNNIRLTTYGTGTHIGVNHDNTDVSSIYLGADSSSKNAVFMLRGGNAADTSDANEYTRFEQKVDGLNIDIYKGFFWLNGGAFLFNSDQGNHDFRVYGQSDSFLIRADVSADKVGIGVSVPTEKLDVDGNIHASGTIEGNLKTDGYTFATLPTASTGMICYITDASSVSYRGTASGGGSDTALVFYNGTNWIYH